MFEMKGTARFVEMCKEDERKKSDKVSVQKRRRGWIQGKQ